MAEKMNRDRLWDAILGEINLRHFQVADGNKDGSDMETADRIRALLTARLAGGEAVPAIEVFRIAGGDVECCPNPTAEEALACLRDLRDCYDEALATPPARQDEAAVERVDCYEFSVFVDGDLVAGGTGSARDCMREADHYETVYETEGDVSVEFHERRKTTRAALSAMEGK